MSTTIKLLSFLFFTFLSISFANAKAIIDDNAINKYKDSYKNSDYPIKYIFIDEDGNNNDIDCCGGDYSKKIYLLNIEKIDPSIPIYSAEINNLLEGHFSILIENEKIISSDGFDYVVLSMSRPHEYNPKSTHCAGGMGEDRAYLASVHLSQVKILDRHFLGCGDSYSIFQENGNTGYEVTGSEHVRYFFKNGKIYKKEK